MEATNNLLKLLSKHNANATFFIVGEIFEWYPALIDTILAAGHDIGLHGYSHVRLKRSDIFDRELELSQSIISKYNLKYFRAPNLHLTEFDFRKLTKHGFILDSSVYGSSVPEEISNIIELPVSVIGKSSEARYPYNFNHSVRNLQIPYGSGYFIWAFSYLSRFDNAKYKMAVVHPWQIYTPDWNKTGIKLTLVKKPYILPYLTNQRNNLENLLNSFSWTKISDLNF